MNLTVADVRDSTAVSTDSTSDSTWSQARHQRSLGDDREADPEGRGFWLSGEF